jgi:sugar-specific transcriptional regulator TrmB
MIEELEKIGLTNGEARIYYALSQLGASSVGPISDLSRVHRSIIYQVLEKLIKKGLVTFVIENDTKKYQASPPNALLQYLESEKDQIEIKKKNIMEIFPNIISLQAKGKRSAAILYSGFQGILNATFSILDRLKEGEEYYMVNIPARQPEYHHANWEKFQKIRSKKKIYGKQLYNPEVDNKTLEERNSHKYINARRMPINFKTPPTYYFVYKDVTVISLSQGAEPLAVEIINQEVADGFRAYCDWLWKQSKPFKKK